MSGIGFLDHVYGERPDGIYAKLIQTSHAVSFHPKNGMMEIGIMGSGGTSSFTQY
jgi:hypothetical protein